MHNIHPTSHTEEEWIHIRPIFEQLYITEDKELKAVQAILKVRYGFATTTKQCKSRLQKWNIRKNHNEDELLFVARKMLQQRTQGRHTSVKLRGVRMEFDDVVMKHFKRKHQTEEEVWARAEAMTAPTPPCITPGTPDSMPSPASGLSTPESEHILVDTSTISAVVNEEFPELALYCKPATTMLELDFAKLRSSLDATIVLSQKEHSPLRIRTRYSKDVIASLNNAQLCLAARQDQQGISWYDRALVYVNYSIKNYDSDVLQLVSFLLSRFTWETEFRTALFMKLLEYLQEADDHCATSPLPVIASALIRYGHCAQHASLAFQRFIVNYISAYLGDETIVSLWLNMRLCRQAFARGERERAKLLLQQCQSSYSRMANQLDSLEFTELGRELSISTHVISGLEHAKPFLEFVLDSVDEASTASDTELCFNRSYCRLRLAFCNMHLRLYNDATIHASVALAFFSKQRGLSDYRTISALYLIQDIQSRAKPNQGFHTRKAVDGLSGATAKIPGNLFGYSVVEVTGWDRESLEFQPVPSTSYLHLNVAYDPIPCVWNQDPALDLSYLYRKPDPGIFEEHLCHSTWAEGYTCGPCRSKEPFPYNWLE